MTAYDRVHEALARERGPASALLCACGEQAVDWAYVGPREPGERKPYSTNLWRDYRAMCRQHHREHDAAMIRASDRANGSMLF